MKGRNTYPRQSAHLACLLALALSTSALAAGPNLSSSTTINFADLANIGGSSQVAVSGTTAVVAFDGCRLDPATAYCPAFLYRLVDGVWVETARLQPAASEVPTDFITGHELMDGFGTGVAVSSDGSTVFVSDATAACSADPQQECGVIDVYVEPAGGWQDMTPSAQLTASTSIATLLGGRLLLSGNDLFAIGYVPSCCTGVYEFTRPAAGWTQATVSAVLSANGGGFGIWGGSLAYDPSASTLAANFGTTRVYVFQGSVGSFSSGNQTATLSSSSIGALDRVGDALSISGGVVALGAPGPFGDSNGSVLVFVKSSGGWADMTVETAALSPASTDLRINAGQGVVVDGNTILAAGETSTIYVFNKPSGGWVSANEDSSVTSPASIGGPMVMTGSSVVEMSGACGLGGVSCIEATLFPAAVPGKAAAAVVMQPDAVPSAGYVFTSSSIPVVVAGKSVSIPFNVENIGAAGASEITLSVAAPAGTSGYSSDTGSCTLANSGVATCPLGSLPAADFSSGGGDVARIGTVTFTAPAKREVFTVSANVATSSLNWDAVDDHGSMQLLSDNPPVAPTLERTSNKGQALSGNVGATDADKDALTYTLTGTPQQGTATLDAHGNYTYTPSSTTGDGTDSIFYSVSDGLLTTDGILKIDLNPPAPPPVTPPSGGGKGGGGADSLLGLLLLLGCLGLRRRSAA